MDRRLPPALLAALGLADGCVGDTKAESGTSDTAITVSVCLTSSPCLTVAPTGDTGVFPCLGAYQPTGDTGEEPLVTGDTGVDTADTADTGAPTAARVRQQVLGSGRLPADVIARLRGR